MPDNRLQLSATFIHEIIAHHQPASQVVTIPLPFGQSEELTIDPAHARIHGAELTIPLQSARVANAALHLRGFSMRDGLLWFEVQKLQFGRFRLPLDLILRVLIRLDFNDRFPLVRTGERFGLDINQRLKAKYGIHLVSFELNDGIVAEFDYAAGS